HVRGVERASTADREDDIRFRPARPLGEGVERGDGQFGQHLGGDGELGALDLDRVPDAGEGGRRGDERVDDREDARAELGQEQGQLGAGALAHVDTGRQAQRAGGRVGHIPDPGRGEADAARGRPADRDGSLSMLARAFRLLDAFTPDRPELSVRELAARAGVPRSTTHRLVGELLAWGALERGGRGVRLGVKLFELGAMAPTPNRLVESASAHLHTLREVTGLTANLAIREGDHVVYLEKIGARDLRVPHSRLGGRGLLHATGLGKAILAFSPQADVDAYLERPLLSLTRATITEIGRAHV